MYNQKLTNDPDPKSRIAYCDAKNNNCFVPVKYFKSLANIYNHLYYP